MKFSHTGSLVHGKIVHALRRQVRIIVPALLNDPERAHVLGVLLQQRDGIEKVKTAPDIAAIAIHFDPKKPPKTKLYALLDALLANLGKRTPSTATRNVKPAKPTVGEESIPEQVFDLTIQGVSCPSCALLVEMLLMRDTRISSADINYPLGTASVVGRISKDALCALIGTMGYKA